MGLGRKRGLGREQMATSPRRPRVCIVRQTNHYELQIQREAEALADEVFDVEVICMRAPGDPRKQVVNGVEITGLSASLRKTSKLRYVFGYASFFVRVAATLTVRHIRRPYAVVQVNTMPDFLVFAAVVPKLFGSRVVAYMHEPSPELAETLFGPGSIARMLRRVEQRVLRFADHSIAVTEQLKERFVECGADPDRISVVLNCADPRSMLEGWSPPNSSSTNGKFRVICHGTIEDRYGQDTVVAAAKSLRDELPEIEVVLVGRGSSAEDLVERIQELGLQDVVRFEGWVSRERLNDLLYTADVGVVAQKASPYSHLVHTNKMVDYWIFGLPVIASRLRAVSEVYDEGVLEFYEAGDEADLARAIRRLHDDPERRKHLARRGRQAQERLGWTVQKRTYLGVYRALLAGRERDGTRVQAAVRLERLLLPKHRFDFDSANGTEPATWLTAGDWRLLARPRLQEQPSGELIERFTLPSRQSVEAVRRDDGTVYVPFDLDEAYRNYVTERWRDSLYLRALKDWQLGLYYRVRRLLPRAFWLNTRKAFIRMGKPPEFPGWPFEDGVDRLTRFAAACHLWATDRESAEFTWFWPEEHRAALILTHDVESAAGLRLAPQLADLEEERGLRSSFNIVASDYKVDAGIVRELRERGFEIGVHGLHHDRSLFSSRAEFERQLPRLADAAQSFEAVGFRSPATYRVVDWLHDLPFAYDCSVPHSDPYEPRPGGCCGLWPYVLGNVVELPYTLPQDHTIFTLLGIRSVEPWLRQVDEIERRFGLIQCPSHPDPGYLGDTNKRAIYGEFLDAVSEREGLWKALPRDVADWWRRRDAGEVTAPERGIGTIRRGSAQDYAHFVPPNGGP